VTSRKVSRDDGRLRAGRTALPRAQEVHDYNLLLRNNIKLNWAKGSQAKWTYEYHYDWSGIQLVPAAH